MTKLPAPARKGHGHPWLTLVAVSLGLMMAAVLFGYLIRLGLIFVAFYVVRDAPWMSVTAFGITVIVTQLGLLFWELKYVSASLAFPGLKPTPQGRSSL